MKLSGISGTLRPNQRDALLAVRSIYPLGSRYCAARPHSLIVMAAAVAKAIALPGEPAPKAIAFKAPMPFHPSRHLKRVEGCGAGAPIQRQAIGSLNLRSHSLQTNFSHDTHSLTYIYDFVSTGSGEQVSPLHNEAFNTEMAFFSP